MKISIVTVVEWLGAFSNISSPQLVNNSHWMAGFKFDVFAEKWHHAFNRLTAKPLVDKISGALEGVSKRNYFY